METFWLEGYKISARSMTQALLALDYLKRRDLETRTCSCGCISGARKDYRPQICIPNPPPC